MSSQLSAALAQVWAQQEAGHRGAPVQVPTRRGRSGLPRGYGPLTGGRHEFPRPLPAMSSDKYPYWLRRGLPGSAQAGGHRRCNTRLRPRRRLPNGLSRRPVGDGRACQIGLTEVKRGLSAGACGKIRPPRRIPANLASKRSLPAFPSARSAHRTGAGEPLVPTGKGPMPPQVQANLRRARQQR